MSQNLEKHRMIIVGGGPSALYVLENLVKKVNDARKEGIELGPHLAIQVIEASSAPGPGIVWEEKSAGRHSVQNIYVPREEISLTGTENLSREDLAHLANNEVPRWIQGEGFKQRYQEAVKALAFLGVDCQTITETKVERVSEYNGEYCVEINSKKGAIEKTADSVVLATGHWAGKDSANTPGVYASPWPADKIEAAIDVSKRVAVMGAGLSGVDAILMAANKAGTFQHAGGKAVFVPHKGNEQFGVDVYSPHGLLPSMAGTLGRVKERISLPDLAAAVTSSKFVSLDKVYDMFRKDFIQKYEPEHGNETDFKAIKAVLQDDSLKFEDAIAKYHEAYRAQGPVKWLQKMVSIGQQSLKDDKPIYWQQYLHHAVGRIEKAYQHANAEDADRFLEHVPSFFLKQYAGMVKSNAEEVLALMESGRLSVHALGTQDHSITVTPGKRGADIRYRDENHHEQNVHFDDVIKASGDNVHKLKSSSLLMKNMLGGRVPLLREAEVVYEKPEAGEAAKKAEDAADPSAIRVVKMQADKQGNITYSRSLGGIAVNRETYEAKQPGSGKEHKNLFVTATLLKAHQPLHEGVDRSNKSAKKIAEITCKRLIEERNLAPPRRPLEEMIVFGGGDIPHSALQGLFEKIMGGDLSGVQFFSGDDGQKARTEKLRETINRSSGKGLPD